MQFDVRVIRGGQIATVCIEATSSDDALRQAESQALRPLAVKARHSPDLTWFRNRAGRFDLLIFSQELLALLQAGLSIIESIATLSEREHAGPTRTVLLQLAARLREGQSLSGALSTVPSAFPGLFIGIVRASERTGDMQPALERYIDYRNRLDSLRSKLVSAAIYPALLLIVGTVVTLFLAGYVVPKFAAVYQGAGRSLPWASSLLLDWGRFTNDNFALLAGCFAIGIAAATSYLRNMPKRGGWPALLRKFPLLSSRLRTYELSRLYLTLGMLLDSGLPIMQSMTLAMESLPSHQRQSMEEASQKIRQGERLSSVFESCDLTTPVGVRMLRVGEESGRLGEMMTRTARFHDGEVARWIERFSRAAEPVLMIAIGLVVGTIVVLLYMPIFDLAGSLR